MSTLRIVCANPRCQKVLRISAKQAGKRIRCPICRVALIAPQVPDTGDEGIEDEDAEDAEPDTAGSGCVGLLLFGLGLLAGLVLMGAAAIAFEVWLYLDNKTATSGPTAAALTAGPWQVTLPKAQGGPAWFARDAVWTFHDNGRAETGRLMEKRNRYERVPANGFRTWTWTVEGDLLKMTFKDEETISFKVVDQTDDKLTLLPLAEGGPALVTFKKVAEVETFPDWRVVFYVTLLLSWLISREVFHSGCLRFALAWPLTVLLGLALGAGAGFLMDMLDDHSHGALPYWMLLSFAQGILCLVMGLWLAVLSIMRS